MSSLEEQIIILLNDISPLIKVIWSKEDKWFLGRGNTLSLTKVNQPSFHFDNKEIQKRIAYIECKDAYEKDITFREASTHAGHWGQFDTVLQVIINRSSKVRKKIVIIDFERASKEFAEFRSKFSLNHLEVEGRARILGVTIKKRKIEFTDGLSIFRLNKKEINDQSPLINAFSTNSPWHDPRVTFHPTELRYSIRSTVDRSAPSGFFNADNEAMRKAREACQHLLEALLLVKEGDISIGPFRVDGGLIPSGISYDASMHIPFPNVVIANKEVKQLMAAYDMLSGIGIKEDKVLLVALRRFFLGRQRRNPLDKLVDYVIAWESILLTWKGNSGKQELSYRFSVNGSSLLGTVTKFKDRKELFKKMKCVYSTRSAIVHGGTDTRIQDGLKLGNFQNLNHVCNFLEDGFRKIFWWLNNLAREKRPYNQIDGWEDLLWKN